MELDQALKVTKPLGRTQFVVAFTSCFIIFVTSWVNLSNVFLTEVSEFHCAASPGLTLEQSVPMEENGVTFAKCDQYVNLNLSADIEDCTNGWEYDTELFGESVTTEFDLVCDRDSLPGLSQSIIIAGMGAGNIIWGPLADRWGRRPTFITALILFNIVGVATAFSNSYVMFACLRFLLAFFHLGSWLPATILYIEYLIPEHRSTVGNLPGVFFSVGLLALSGLAYLVQDWRWFSACLVVPTVIAIPFIWIIPESVRWLLSVSNTEKAEKVMQNVAKFNKARDVPETFFNKMMEPDSPQQTENKNIKLQKLGFLHLFKQPTLEVTLVLTFQWFGFFLVYFGFALSTGKLAGNPYLSFFISALVELPARIIPIWLLKISGRIIPLSLSFLIGSIMMVAMVILESGTISFTVCALVGKFCISFIFQPILLVTSELFPTTMRNIGAGVVQLGGRGGSILSPILLYLDNSYPGLAFGSMAFVSFFAAVTIFLLPETLNAVQPTTIDDLRVLMRTKRLVSRKGFRKPVNLDSENSGGSKIGNSSLKTQENGKHFQQHRKEAVTEDKDGGIRNSGFEDVSLEFH